MQTRIVVVLDRSGSMESRKDAVIEGFNGWLSDIKRTDPDAKLNLYLFHDRVEHVLGGADVTLVSELDELNYRPGGATALWDAMAEAMLGNPDDPEGEDLRTLMVIITDGYENASREHDRRKVLDMVREREDRHRWTFVYLGADIDAFGEAGSVGIARGNTLGHSADDYGGAFMAASVATQVYLQQEISGTRSFFQDAVSGSLELENGAILTRSP